MTLPRAPHWSALLAVIQFGACFGPSPRLATYTETACMTPAAAMEHARYVDALYAAIPGLTESLEGVRAALEETEALVREQERLSHARMERAGLHYQEETEQ